MSIIEPIPFAHHLLAPPMNFPFGIRSGRSMFNADREGKDFYRCHEGIDLYPKGALPFNGSIYAVNCGVVESVVDHGGPDWEIVIRHHPLSSGVCTLYRHLNAKEAHIIQNCEVEAGELIGHIDSNLSEPHLHFHWALKKDPADPFAQKVSGHRIFNQIPLDPTPLLYRFEAYRWPGTKDGVVPRYQHENTYPYSKISRIRVESWPDRRAAIWLLQVAMPDRNNPTTGEEVFYLPINHALPHEKLMTDVINDAFHKGYKVRLGWRDSYFYGERWMIEDVRVRG